MTTPDHVIRFRVTISTDVEIEYTPEELEGLNTPNDVERSLTDAITDGAYTDCGVYHGEHRVHVMNVTGDAAGWELIHTVPWPDLAKRLGVPTAQ